MPWNKNYNYYIATFLATMADVSEFINEITSNIVLKIADVVSGCRDVRDEWPANKDSYIKGKDQPYSILMILECGVLLYIPETFKRMDVIQKTAAIRQTIFYV